MNLRCILAAFAVAAGAGVATAAFAATATDPNDVAGKLDLKSVSGTFTGGGSFVRVNVGMYDAFATSNLPQTGSSNRLWMLFDSDSNGTADFKARIVGANGKFSALLSGHGNSFEPLPVKRTGNVLTTTIPADVFPQNGQNLRIAARSVFKGGACATACIDRAPNSGWVAVS